MCEIRQAILLLFDLLLMLLGGAVAGLSLYVMHQEGLMGEPSAALSRLAVATAAGLSVAVLGLIGCCGTLGRSPCLLNTHSIVLLLLLLAEAGFFGYVIWSRKQGKDLGLSVHIGDEAVIDVSIDCSSSLGSVACESQGSDLEDGPLLWTVIATLVVQLVCVSIGFTLARRFRYQRVPLNGI